MTDTAHRTSVLVWDVPSAVESGRPFTVRVGVRCEAGCSLNGSPVEVSDTRGCTLAIATLGDVPWPGTDALYAAAIELMAPDEEGLRKWAARFAGAPGCEPRSDGQTHDGPTHDGPPHERSETAFHVRTVPEPDCVLRVLAIDRARQVPIAGARVVVHPYRTCTDEAGIAEIGLAHGRYRLFVSGHDYFPFRSDGEVSGNMTIRAELEPDPEPTDAEFWS